MSNPKDTYRQICADCDYMGFVEKPDGSNVDFCVKFDDSIVDLFSRPDWCPVNLEGGRYVF